MNEEKQFDLLQFAATIESAKEAIKFLHISGVDNADVAREIQDKVYKAFIAYQKYIEYITYIYTTDAEKP